MAETSEKSAENPPADQSEPTGTDVTWVDGHWVCPDPTVPGGKLFWDDSSQNWLKTPANMTFEGGRWVHTDPISKVKKEHNVETNTWVEIQPNPAESDSDDEDKSDSDQNDDEDEFAYQLRMEKRQRKRVKTGVEGTIVDPDGSERIWDPKVGGWVPKVDEDFIAKYQAGYGLTPLDTSALEKNLKATTSAVQTAAAASEADAKEERKRAKQERRKVERKDKSWFDIDSDHNTNVYVTGLPHDVTDKEFEDFMAKCGVIAKELDTNKLKLKLYRDADGNPKGDGRCGYVRKESIDLALQILDGNEIRPGHKVTVERAKFELKGEFDPKKRKKISLKAKKKAKERQEKLFDWRPDQLRGERPKHDCTVVIKNLFHPDEFLGNATLLFDLQEMLKSICTKFGEVKKVAVYDTNPEGIATVTFGTAEMADDSLVMLDFRQIRVRQVRAERWDGKTKFKVAETEEDRQRRIERWEAQLEGV